MSAFTSLPFDQIQRLRKFVQKEHKQTFGRELSLVQTDQFIASYWGEYMENELKVAIDNKIVE